VVIHDGGAQLCSAPVADLEAAWKRPLDLDQTLVAGGGK